MKKFLISIALLLTLVPVVHASTRFFEIQSIDTMKYSRDDAKNDAVTKVIPLLVEKVASLHPTHIAVATPYDEEFYPVLKVWVSEARKHGLKVWFRGNFSSWEGWFNYPKFPNPNDHNLKSFAFITGHPDLFQEGDIFTPVPEPENGGFGDPRQSETIKQQFLNFLPVSYENCVLAFEQIQRSVKCGYYSVNGDVARDIMTKDVILKTGGVLVIDHYVKTPEKLITDISLLHLKFGVPIVLGEFGAPIPDINGKMTDEQQYQYIRGSLLDLSRNSDVIQGVNYWTAFRGSTKIFTDNFEPKKATLVIQEYFQPLVVIGKVTDSFNQPLEGVRIGPRGLKKVFTDKSGLYQFATTKDFPTIIAEKESFFSQRFNVRSDRTNNTITKNLLLPYQSEGIFGYLRTLLNSLFGNIHSQ